MGGGSSKQSVSQLQDENKILKSKSLALMLETEQKASESLDTAKQLVISLEQTRQAPDNIALSLAKLVIANGKGLNDRMDAINHACDNASNHIAQLLANYKEIQDDLNTREYISIVMMNPILVSEMDDTTQLSAITQARIEATRMPVLMKSTATKFHTLYSDISNAVASGESTINNNNHDGSTAFGALPTFLPSAREVMADLETLIQVICLTRQDMSHF
mmetsp:Transcript_4809/g.8456  ORF Transcript_4809/g.8456 Transcript_4809/m.8456 type:complete len:219 (-) Transcript_4809:127-783(-)|eukprot:CAMPEP_0198293032 /NCGR_PEP_ID=MMETSP1449-20131203/15026_1 /TAXON_ID=420275 /ORGANISM="Attheya septentrionalis, Strain CCMP2084" /LENGTH=218 /DNA_ID=CAMNT_0043992437 /DNA_START=148 /DNA_END=804 /DNA_ORIENTATION=+